jgi:CDP-glycerol glycerophosphotransferase (TagB/SpsB family)
MSKKKILFQLNYLYHLPAVRPIIELFSHDNNYDVVFEISRDFEYKLGFFRKRLPQSNFDKYFPPNVRSYEKKEEFDVVFVTDVITKSKNGNALQCMVYHGPTFNKTVTYRELQRNRTDNYIIFVESQYTADKLIESNSIEKSEVVVVGFPKLDPFLNGNYNKKSIVNELGLDKNKKTILYAPTYKPTSIYNLYENIFETTRQYNLIIKLHHYSWMGKYANRNQSRLFEKQLEHFDHAILMPKDNYDIVPLYIAADTLISEASGALTEFLITEKMGIVFKLKDIEIMRSNSESLLSYDKDYLQNEFIHISSPNQLPKAIERALKPKRQQIENIRIFKKKYFYKNDGKASARIKTYIDNILL